MSSNPTTGIKVITPSDWVLKDAPGWDQRSPEKIAEEGPDLRPRPQTMVIASEFPYVDLLEEPPHHYSAVHHHTEPEVLVVLRGRMVFNGVPVGPGTMIYIPANEEYWHSTDEEGCLTGVIRPQQRGFLVGYEQTRGRNALSDRDTRRPYPKTLASGERLLWCACGKSATQPLCDGVSHKGTDKKPQLFKAPDARTVTLCGCKQTNNPPFCDGSHCHLTG